MRIYFLTLAVFLWVDSSFAQEHLEESAIANIVRADEYETSSDEMRRFLEATGLSIDSREDSNTWIVSDYSLRKSFPDLQVDLDSFDLLDSHLTVAIDDNIEEEIKERHGLSQYEMEIVFVIPPSQRRSLLADLGRSGAPFELPSEYQLNIPNDTDSSITLRPSAGTVDGDLRWEAVERGAYSTIEQSKDGLSGLFQLPDGELFRIQPVDGLAHAIYFVSSSKNTENKKPEEYPAPSHDPERLIPNESAALRPPAMPNPCGTYNTKNGRLSALNVRFLYEAEVAQVVGQLFPNYSVPDFIEDLVNQANQVLTKNCLPINLIEVVPAEVLSFALPDDDSGVVDAKGAIARLLANWTEFSGIEIEEEAASEKKLFTVVLTGSMNMYGLAAGIGPTAPKNLALVEVPDALQLNLLLHELGHLLGARHENVRDIHKPPYAHGFVWQDFERHSIVTEIYYCEMTPNCRVLGVLSNPRYIVDSVRLGELRTRDNNRVFFEFFLEN